MKVIFSKTICRKEKINEKIRLLIMKFLAKGVFIKIKGEFLPKNSQLIKIYATTAEGARRIIFLVDLRDGKMFFLFYRSKNDKIGENITIKNKEFKSVLHKYLKILKEDILSENCCLFEV